ncbi:hypothetical protein ACHAXR_002165 [Thalassiosira sp. AJA248-18]
MKKSTTTATLLILSVQFFQGSSFVGSIQRDGRSATSLFGTIRFVGNANANLSTPSIITTDQDEDKSLSNFLTSPASDPVLLGSKKDAKGGGVSECRQMDDNESAADAGVLWECRQAKVEWFGLKIQPIFINRLEKASDNVVISIIDAQTEVEKGGRLGNTLASAMKRSQFEGRNVISWKEQNGANNESGAQRNYALEGNLKLTLTINLPPFLPLPPGFNAIGSKIVERTCRDRLRQNLSDISDAYLVWATSPE